MPIAITREPAPDMATCELSYVARTAIDTARAAEQHRAYQRTLAVTGCRVLVLEAEPGMPDSVFVEDVAVVVDEVAVMTRPGAESRRAEGGAVAELLARYRPMRHIVAPGTLDGGDVLRMGRVLFVGRSARTNDDGIAQLTEILAPFGYEVRPVAMRDCLHLKSAVTAVGDDTMLLQPAWVDAAPFSAYRVIEVADDEPHAANTLRIGDAVLMPDCFPRTRQKLEVAGIATITVDVSELQKAEGAVTCCSIVFDGRVAE